MRIAVTPTQRREIYFSVCILLITVLLLVLPFSSEYYQHPESEVEARCRVLATDDSFVFQRGIFRQGEQGVDVELLDGPDRGRRIHALNLLQGAVELEWFYQPGEEGIIGYSKQGETIVASRMLEPVRERPLIGLFLLFFGLIFILAGWTGIKAILSFAFTLIVIWKILLPLNLQGKYDPVLLAILITALLCFVVIFLVAGFNKKGWGAFLGAFGGCAFTWIILGVFGGAMKVNGTVSGFSSTLRYSGYEHLDLLKLFYAAVILSASGAIMDVAMDISASMVELKAKRPDIGRWELIKSGLNIGRAVIGTMSTTLLLAYSGGAMTMLMYLLSRGISIWRIMNMNYVASEALRTVSGTIGLTFVVPFTALVSGCLLTPVLEKNWNWSAVFKRSPIKKI